MDDIDKKWQLFFQTCDSLKKKNFNNTSFPEIVLMVKLELVPSEQISFHFVVLTYILLYMNNAKHNVTREILSERKFQF